MKKLLFLLLSAFSLSFAYAQEETTDGMSIDVVFDACVYLQESLEANDTVALSKAAVALKESNTQNFAILQCNDDSVPSLNGHLVFNEAFIDSLLNGSDPYVQADSINRSGVKRGQTTNGTILTKTCFVKARQSTKYSFPSRGPQELGIVTEPGGRVFVKVHATNKAGLDEWHNDNKNAVKGARRFKTSFNLPTKTRNTVEIEVINKGDKDISFVVISN